MTHYYFHMLSGGQTIRDPDGQELETLESARTVAELSLCEIAADRLRAGEIVHIEAIGVVDASGIEHARISTEDAVLARFSSFDKFRR